MSLVRPIHCYHDTLWADLPNLVWVPLIFGCVSSISIQMFAKSQEAESATFIQK
jgi:hypothetical protein